MRIRRSASSKPRSGRTSAAWDQARAEQAWKIQPQRSSSSALLHRGNCTLYKNDFGYINREDALVALAEPDIEACQICNPQTGLQ